MRIVDADDFPGGERRRRNVWMEKDGMEDEDGKVERRRRRGFRMTEIKRQVLLTSSITCSGGSC